MGRKSTWDAELPRGFKQEQYNKLAALKASELVNVLHVRLHALRQCYSDEMKGKRVIDLLRLPAQQRIDCAQKARAGLVSLDMLAENPLDTQGFKFYYEPGSQGDAAVRDLRLDDLNGGALLFTYLPEEYKKQPNRSVRSLVEDDAVLYATLDRVVRENGISCSRDICSRLHTFRNRLLNDHLMPCVIQLDRTVETIQSEFNDWLSATRRDAGVRAAAESNQLRAAIITNQIVKIVDLGLLVGPRQGKGYTLAALAHMAGLSRPDRFSEIAGLLDCCIDLKRQGQLLL